MKVLAIVHAFPPAHGSGAEWMLHDMFQFLQEQGHQVKVVVTKIKPEPFNGIEVVGSVSDRELSECDIIISHLGQTGVALNTATQYGKPFVFISHNTHKYAVITARKKGVYVIYNSSYVEGALWQHYHKHPSVILHPPVDQKHYEVRSKREKITLINYNDAKGGVHLQSIARRLKDRQFLAVAGAYGDQVTDQPGNVEQMPNMADIREAYRKTKILIMPSRYETYGRTAIEAMSSGIPVIASATPGLKESCGDAGYIIQDMHNIDRWVEAIVEVEANYDEWSKRAKLWAKQVSQKTSKELAGFERFLQDAIADKWKHNIEPTGR